MKKRLLSLILAAAMLLGLAMPAMAMPQPDWTPAQQAEFVLQRISSPNLGLGQPGEVDGLVEDGDRANSGVLSMVEYNSSIYITTLRSIGAALISRNAEAIGMDEDALWAAVNVVTNGDLPREGADYGQILRYDPEDGSFTILYTSEEPGVAYRALGVVNGAAYFGSQNLNGGELEILRLTEDELLEQVFTAEGGVAIRAACVADSLYVACVKDGSLTVLCQDDEDYTKWETVADGEDFDGADGESGSMPAFVDMAYHNGYLYVTLSSAGGFLIYRGVPSEDAGSNDYDWYWEGVATPTVGPNLPGLNAGAGSYRSVTGKLFEFQGDLYAYTSDAVLPAVMTAWRGVLDQVSGGESKASEYLQGIYGILQNPQKIFRMDDETGMFEEVESFTELTQDTTIECITDMAEYDGKLYVSTLDANTLYGYLTQLTDGSFRDAKPMELLKRAGYIRDLIELVKETEDATGIDLTPLKEAFEKAAQMLTDMAEKGKEIAAEKLDEFYQKYAGLEDELEAAVQDAVEKLKALDWGGIVDSITGKSSEIIDQIKDGAVDLRDLVFEKLGDLKDLIPEGVTDEYTQKLQELLAQLEEAKEKAQEAIQEKLDAAKAQTQEAKEKLEAAAQEKLDAAKAQAEEIKGKIQELVAEYTQKVQETLDTFAAKREEAQAQVEEAIQKLRAMKVRDLLEKILAPETIEKFLSGDIDLDDLILDQEEIQTMVQDLTEKYTQQVKELAQQIKDLAQQIKESPETARQMIAAARTKATELVQSYIAEVKTRLENFPAQVENLKDEIEKSINDLVDDAQQRINNLLDMTVGELMDMVLAAEVFHNIQEGLADLNDLLLDGLDIRKLIPEELTREYTRRLGALLTQMQEARDNLEKALQEKAEAAKEQAQDVREKLEAAAQEKIAEAQAKVEELKGQIQELITEYLEKAKEIVAKYNEMKDQLAAAVAEAVEKVRGMDLRDLVDQIVESELAQKIQEKAEDLRDLVFAGVEKAKELIPDELEEKFQEKMAALIGAAMAAKGALENLTPEDLAELKDQLLSCLKDFVTETMENAKEKVDDLKDSIDLKGIMMYLSINDMVAKNEAGFDLFRSADGEDFEVLTRDGFGDKYNIAASSLLATGEGLLVGTNNPFYGAQLYQIGNVKPTLPCDGENCPGAIFTDMPAKGNWAHDAIDWAIVEGVTNGATATTFAPGKSVTRAEVVTFLWRACGSVESVMDNPYTDVKETDYFYDAVLWAANNNITLGTSATTFDPKAECTRAQVVTFLHRMAGEDVYSKDIVASDLYSDVKNNAFYSDAVIWATMTGVATGVTDSTFAPKGTCTRAQAVTFLYRFFNDMELNSD